MNGRLDFTFVSFAELEATAHGLGETLFSPETSPEANSTLILLAGELGAGKTELVRQILRTRGFGPVTSPTYTLHHIYESVNSPYVVHHFDFYRLLEPRELEDFDFFRLLTEKPSHLFVEWPKWNLTSKAFLEKLDRDVLHLTLHRKHSSHP